MLVLDGICTAIGQTPLIPLRKVGDLNHQVYGKCEFMNPAGSAKDRPALFMIEKAIMEGKITSSTTIIESSSGNMAISLAMICNYLKLKLICVVDPKTTKQHLDLIKIYGASIEHVSTPDEETGEFLPARIKRVKSLLDTIPDSFWTNQYGNEQNYLSHFATTMKEIVSSVKQVDYLFCGVSSCGTIRGCAEYVKQHHLSTKIIAVDAFGSLIFSDQSSKRVLPGLGAAIKPPLSDRELIDQVVYVSDQDCIEGCQKLLQKESLLCGASSGGVLMAYQTIRSTIPKNSTCVLIFPDRGERYLNTIYSDAWVKEALSKTSK